MEGITVDRLFRVSKDIELLGHKLKVRALSDLEMQLRHREAMRASVVVERALRDPDSTESLVNLAPLEQSAPDDLKSILVIYHQRETQIKAAREIPLDYLPFPDEATEEEQREVLARRETHAKLIQDKRKASVEQEVESYRKSLEDKSVEWLLAQAKGKTIMANASASFAEEFALHTIYTTLETPEGKRYFDSLDEVRLVPASVRNLILTTFSEVNDLDPLRLNGQSATG